MKYIIFLMVTYVLFYIHNFPGGPKGFLGAMKRYYGGAE